MPSAAGPDLQYVVYGLRVQSPVPISGPEPRAFEGSPDCNLICAPVSSPDDAVTIDADDETGVRVSRSAAQPDRVTFEYADGTRFLVEGGGRRITTSWTSTREDMATYLLGPILAFVLRSRGTLALHASAVSLQGRAILLTAAATGGKSTTAAALVRNGAAMLSDDVSAIGWNDGSPFVQPGYPRLRVWSDSAAALYGSEDALPLLTPMWTKRYIDTRDAFVSTATPIAAVLVLAGRDAEETRMRELRGHEAAMALLARTSVPHLLTPHERSTELEQITRLVTDVRVLEVVAKNDLSDTDHLAQSIAAATAIR